MIQIPGLHVFVKAVSLSETIYGKLIKHESESSTESN